MPILTFKGWSEFALGLAGLEVSWKGVSSYHIKHKNCKLRTILDISWLESATQPQKIPTSPYVIQAATHSSLPHWPHSPCNDLARAKM